MMTSAAEPRLSKKIISAAVILLTGIVIYMYFTFRASPYRTLRPYELFGKRMPEEKQIETININGRKAVKVDRNGNDFYIDQVPVKISAYKKCVKGGICTVPHYRDSYLKYYKSPVYASFPVTFVTWEEARNFCLGYGGDLPTGEQWSAAAGDGRYAWGDSKPTLAKANIDGWYQSHLPVGWQYQGASPFGILDMNGNVREWILDENEDGEKGLKGAGFNDSWDTAETEHTYWHHPNSSGFNRGFRCVYEKP